MVGVTGFAGFIGQHVTRMLLDRGDYVFGIDAFTYAAGESSIWRLEGHPRFKYVRADIRTLDHLPDVDAVIHLAAETHVDNSITDPIRFAETNYLGTANLLQLLRAKRAYEIPRLVHISTDEVYGSLPTGRAVPTDPLRPASPYAASKAAADLLVEAWRHTYALRAAVVRPSNCYGPGQFPEKLIPKAIRCLMLGRPIPVHGDGSQTRQWLHVEDCARAILAVLDRATDGGIYNVAGNTEARVWDIVRELVYGYHGGRVAGRWQDAVAFGYTRPAMDTRYAVDDAPLRALGWTAQRNLWHDLPALVEQERQRFRW